MILNVFQKAVLEDYSNGDYADMGDDGVIENVHDLGDTLLTFLMIELSSGEDCTTVEDANLRLNTARDDLDVALLAMQKLAEAFTEKMENHRADTAEDTVL